MEMLRSLVRPSRWRLDIEQRERDDLDASMSAAIDHLERVINKGVPFEVDIPMAILNALRDLLYTPYSHFGGAYPVYPASPWGPGSAPPGGGAPASGQDASAAVPAGSAIETVTDTVRLGMSAPQSVRPGEEFTARFVAYLPVLEEQVREILSNLSPRSTSHLGPMFSQHWVRGTEVTVKLRGQYLVCEKPQQEFTWDGNMSLVDFDVQIQPSAPEGFTILKFDVTIGSIDVGNLRLDLEISNDKSSSTRQNAAGNAARRAFASYASQDQSRVLDRVAAVAISAGLQVFMDCLSLHPGEFWKPRLEEEIVSSDLFLLFWSQHARKSSWVDGSGVRLLEQGESRQYSFIR